jgi:hypothetical protein
LLKRQTFIQRLNIQGKLVCFYGRTVLKRTVDYKMQKSVKWIQKKWRYITDIICRAPKYIPSLQKTSLKFDNISASY